MAEYIDRSLQRSRRNLPHWQAGRRTYFVTWNCIAGESLRVQERAIVVEAATKFHGDRYNMFALVVMPDHVHMLIQPLEKSPKLWWHLGRLLGGMKGASARKINASRGRNGALWQEESFDRLLREGEFEDKWNYIRLNPVRAGLVGKPDDYDALWIRSTADGWMQPDL